MRAQFVRGEDPMDTMELGDVRGRKLKAVKEKLEEAFRRIFAGKKYYKPKFEIEYKETNVGFGNRDQLDTDRVIISLLFKGYSFSLTWQGNPLNSKVIERFFVNWKQQFRGPEDGDTFMDLNSAIDQLKKWIATA
jgi:hypothetical protein